MRNYFNWALVISIGIHLIILTGIPNFYSPSFKKTKLTPPKTEFIEIKKEKINLPQKFFSETPPPYLELKKSLSQIRKIESISLKKIKLQTTILNPKELVLTKTKQELDSYPPYMDYYEKIREKIKETAYKNFTINSSGKVFINFTINNSGNLISLYLDEKNSNAPRTLKELAKSSIEKSAPFPKFPEELKRFRTLTFNLSIQFKSN